MSKKERYSGVKKLKIGGTPGQFSQNQNASECHFLLKKKKKKKKNGKVSYVYVWVGGCDDACVPCALHELVKLLRLNYIKGKCSR